MHRKRSLSDYHDLILAFLECDGDTDMIATRLTKTPQWVNRTFDLIRERRVEGQFLEGAIYNWLRMKKKYPAHVRQKLKARVTPDGSEEGYQYEKVKVIPLAGVIKKVKRRVE